MVEQARGGEQVDRHRLAENGEPSGQWSRDILFWRFMAPKN